MRIRIRKASDRRMGLVYDSAIKYLANAGLGRTRVDAGARRVLDRVLTRPSTEVRLAVEADDTDHIVGLAVLDRELRILHWVYVRADDRRCGVARALLDGLGPMRCWHAGRNSEHVGRVVELRYDPLCLAEI